MGSLGFRGPSVQPVDQALCRLGRTGTSTEKSQEAVRPAGGAPAWLPGPRCPLPRCRPSPEDQPCRREAGLVTVTPQAIPTGTSGRASLPGVRPPLATRPRASPLSPWCYRPLQLTRATSLGGGQRRTLGPAMENSGVPRGHGPGPSAELPEGTVMTRSGGLREVPTSEPGHYHRDHYRKHSGSHQAVPGIWVAQGSCARHLG